MSAPSPGPASPSPPQSGDPVQNGRTAPPTTVKSRGGAIPDPLPEWLATEVDAYEAALRSRFRRRLLVTALFASAAGAATAALATTLF